ncbi:MAG: 3-oxoacyl-ACP reductase [Anaerolineae bacterium]|nr:SDR family oxidoreductase [Anaerolineae bacterium]MCQ3975571.1 3-oxoacyl-ACP reductase [Anaerolineae bacterium]
MKLVEGKVAIVTGSGRGIGAATAKLLAQHGARLVVSDLDEAPAEETAAAIRAAGGEAITFCGDVTQPNFPAAIVQKSAESYGGLDILVNNAGFTWDSMLHTMTDKQWDVIMGVHLTTPFRMGRAAASVMREQAKAEIAATGQAQPRKIVNISSISAFYGNIGQANYAAAKAGVVGLTRVIAREWGRFNIQANAVSFGWIETRLTADKAQGEAIEMAGEKVALGIPQSGLEARKQLIALGRPGTPEEAAGPILFLCSPLANYVTGHLLKVDGGR